MQPDKRFLTQPPQFWANVRTISEKVGYTQKRLTKAARAAPKDTDTLIRIPTLDEVISVYEQFELASTHIAKNDKLTSLGATLFGYFKYRAQVLNEQVRPSLMDKEQAKREYELLFDRYAPKCHQPTNLQKGDKKGPAYFTCIINMLIEANIGDRPCNYNPQVLTTFTKGGFPVRTLARRVDGAFPSTVNPIALWEIKEYYNTTTFGSRVADGIYESLLDGMELEELHEHEGLECKHYLFVDAFGTWWKDGKSYLCRMIDMMHMGYVDEVLFGREVIERVPKLAKEWVARLEGDSPGVPEDTGSGH